MPSWWDEPLKVILRQEKRVEFHVTGHWLLTLAGFSPRMQTPDSRGSNQLCPDYKTNGRTLCDLFSLFSLEAVLATRTTEGHF